MQFSRKTDNSFNITAFIRLLTISSILLLFLSIFLFIWISSNINTPNLSNYQDFNNLFEIYIVPLFLIIILLIIFTFRVTLIKIQQMNKQIRTAYRPELSLLQQNLYIYTKRTGGYANNIIVSTEETI